MTEEQIKYMVNRFLCWRLPQDFRPDAGISYRRPNYHPSVDATPSGTNLFDATQAEAMVRHMIAGMPGDGQARSATAPQAGGEVARPIAEWHEDIGPVIWWVFPISEPPYVGTIDDDYWPGYHTHWTPIHVPSEPAAAP